MSSTVRTAWVSSLLFSLIPTVYAGYAPTVSSTCASPLPTVRPGTILSDQEASYVKNRLSTASRPFQQWLRGISSEFDVTDIPVIGLASSGGGYLALLSDLFDYL